MKSLFPVALLCLLVLLLFWLISRSQSTSVSLKPSPGRLTSRPLNAATGEGTRRFTALSAESTGIEFTHRLVDDQLVGEKFMTLLHTSVGAGICVADVDGDGLPDLFVCSKTGGSRLFKQTAAFKFKDITDKAGVRGDPKAWNTGAGFADVDNDGDMDLYVCRHDAPNLFYINSGNGRFDEQAKKFGLDYVGASVMAAFCDYDRDGDLDMYLLTNRRTPSAEFQLTINQHLQQTGRVPEEIREYEGIYDYIDKHGKRQRTQIRAGQKDLLFRNDGKRFSDVSEQAGIEGYELGHNALWFDYNGDLWPDLYISNDYHGKDRFYRNLGDGRFQDVALEVLPHTPWFSMGADAADINRDGRFDLLATDMSATDHLKQKVTMGNMTGRGWFLSVAEPRQYMRNALFLNTHSERFMEIAYLAGVDSTDWTWTVKFGDLDNDGWSDLYVTNGMFRHFMDGDLWTRIYKAQDELSYRTDASPLPLFSDRPSLKSGVRSLYREKREAGVLRQMVMESPQLKERNLAFKNLDGLRFEKTSQQWGLDHLGISYSAVFADMDRDGDLDIITNHFDEPLGVYRNNTIDQNAILVELVGRLSNRTGYGAVVRVTTDDATQTKTLLQARGYMASDDPVLHFGLGSQSKIENLEVVWPSGHKQKFDDLDVGYVYTVEEPTLPVESGGHSVAESSVTPSWDSGRRESLPLFSDRTEASRLEWNHAEERFDDYEVQPLLPYQLSRLGPGVAVADVNGDGIEDFFAAGGNGKSGQLFLGEAGETFRPQPGPWERDSASEDLAPLFFDADGDGDSDLYVSAGGVECGADNPLLTDRLYFNQGSGEFEKPDDVVLPQLQISSSCALAADFDRDGDLDLFVGGRVQPGKYPHAARSSLLQNDGGRFTDVTEQHDPSFASLGLVTSALWSDADDDGWLDLLVATEWGPVHLFDNNAGTLTQVTEAAGLSPISGWFNSLVAGDFNSDGRMDYVAGNVGLNSKYKASEKTPALIYSGDFGDQGELRCVEATFDHGHLYPVRGKSCSTDAMPHLGERFKTYNAFGKADLIDIYTNTKLDEAERFSVNELAHLLLINRGSASTELGEPAVFEVRELPFLAQAAPVFGMAVADFDADGHKDLILGQNFYAPQPETGHMDGGIGLLLKGDGRGNLEPVGPNESGILLGGDTKGLALCDNNQDGWPDIIVGQNRGPVRLLQHNGVPEKEPLIVSLTGTDANPNAIGARLQYWQDGELLETTEVYAGTGYLSQSTSRLFLVRRSRTGGTLKVRWPNGMTSEQELGEGVTVELMQP